LISLTAQQDSTAVYNIYTQRRLGAQGLLRLLRPEQRHHGQTGGWQKGGLDRARIALARVRLRNPWPATRSDQRVSTKHVLRLDNLLFARRITVVATVLIINRKHLGACETSDLCAASDGSPSKDLGGVPVGATLTAPRIIDLVILHSAAFSRKTWTFENWRGPILKKSGRP
jgi:hypothetical protein